MPDIIPIENIKDGMTVAEPILNNFGQVLVPSGATLKETHKKLLKTWNIMTVVIQGDDSDDEFELTEELKQLAMEKLKERMAWEPRNNNEQDLLLMGIQFTAGEISKNSG